MVKFLFSKKIFSLKGGFTLLELMIATSIFTVVMMVSVESLASLLAATRKIQAQNIVMGNLDLALENIGRNLRLGYNYHCGANGNLNKAKDCATTGDNFISFTAASGLRTAFRYDSAGHVVQKSTNCNAGGCSNWTNLTAPEITVNSMFFYVDGTGSADNRQPRVLINIQGQAGDKPGQDATFQIQTAITQRILD